MKISAIIPARYASTRFPGKPLALLGGQPMIQRVYEQVVQCTRFEQVVVATDDDRIAAAVRAFGGQLCLTRPDHPSGTDRIAEAAEQLLGADIIVNVQGDEPFVQPAQLEQLCDFFTDPAVDIATLAHPLTALNDILDPNVVKVVRAANGRALYFSRSPIPYLRAQATDDWPAAGQHYQHLGLYAYRRPVLQALTQLPPSPLELAESLEQLRWLEAGYSIYVGTTLHKSIGIDTPADLSRAQQMFK